MNQFFPNGFVFLGNWTVLLVSSSWAGFLFLGAFGFVGGDLFGDGRRWFATQGSKVRFKKMSMAAIGSPQPYAFAAAISTQTCPILLFHGAVVFYRSVYFDGNAYAPRDREGVLRRGRQVARGCCGGVA